MGFFMIILISPGNICSSLVTIVLIFNSSCNLLILYLFDTHKITVFFCEKNLFKFSCNISMVPNCSGSKTLYFTEFFSKSTSKLLKE